MGLQEIQNGTLADATVVDDNFKYLDGKITDLNTACVNLRTYVNSTVQSYKEDVIEAKEEMEDTVKEGFNFVETEVHTYEPVDEGTVEDERTGYRVKMRFYNNSTTHYIRIAGGSSPETFSIPYNFCNKYWTKKTYKNYEKTDLLEVECGGYFYLNVNLNTSSAYTVTFTLPEDISWVDYNIDFTLSGNYQPNSNSFYSAKAYNTTITAIRAGSPFYAGITGKTGLFSSFSIFCPKVSTNTEYDCLVHWRVRQNKLEPTQETDGD